MRVTVAQVFYGRGERGYCVLSASPGGATYVRSVEKLCGAIGMPGIEYDGEPFLVSTPEDDAVVMLCGRRGVHDSMGRSTLFFHVLVARRTDLDAARADAFSFFSKGVFLDSVPTGVVSDIDLEVHAIYDEQSNGISAVGVPVPAFVRAPRPLTEVVRILVGDRANSISWATYTFQPLERFDIQVVPKRISAPRGMDEYDESGRIVRKAYASSSMNVDKSPRPTTVLRHDSEKKPIQHEASMSKPLLLKLSLAANLVLAAICVILLFSRKDVHEQVSKIERIVVTNETNQAAFQSTPALDKAKIEKIALEHYREELKERFKFFRIENFKNAAKDAGLPKFDDIYSGDAGFREAKSFLDKAEAYINFVNSEILNNQP